MNIDFSLDFTENLEKAFGIACESLFEDVVDQELSIMAIEDAWSILMNDSTRNGIDVLRTLHMGESAEQEWMQVLYQLKKEAIRQASIADNSGVNNRSSLKLHSKEELELSTKINASYEDIQEALNMYADI